jgi:hypothetical protein
MDRGLQLGPEVLAARMALSTLSDPAAGALRWLSWFGANRRLSPELPALRVAPFGVLPASLVVGGDIEPDASDASSPRVLRPIVRVETDTTRGRSGAMSEGSTTAGRRARRPRTGHDDVHWLAAPAGSSDEPVFLLPSQGRLSAAETDGAAGGGRPRELPDHAGSTGEPPEVVGAQQHDGPSPSEGSALTGLVAALWPSASERSTRTSSSDVRPSRLFGLAQPKVELVPEPVVAVGLSDVGGGLDDAFASIDVIPEERSAADHVARPPATNRPIQDGSDRERGAQRIDIDPLEGAASRQDPPWPDGSELSELLNSVLVEQARRAGVDLS